MKSFIPNYFINVYQIDTHLIKNSGADGGDFYYQPKIGYTFQSKNDLYLYYKGLSGDGYTLNSIYLGYAYKF